MAWRNDKVRPDRETFAALCARYTYQEIAEEYQVTTAAVHGWARRHGIKPIPKKHKAQLEAIKQRTRDPFCGFVTPGRINYLAQPNSP